jgi:hypothetical protein
MAGMAQRAGVTASQGVPSMAQLGSPLPVRQRRPVLAAVTLVVIVGLAAIAGYLYEQAGAKTPVVVIARAVPQGHPIERADLTTVAVAGEISAVTAAGMDGIVGSRAEVDLLPGTVLQRSMISDAPLLPASKALVGVAVGPGQMPADGLQPGDTVQVLHLSGTGAAGTAPGPGPVQTVQEPVELTRADVYSVREDASQAGGALLTLVVPRAVAMDVAAASDAQRVALIQLGLQEARS